MKRILQRYLMSVRISRFKINQKQSKHKDSKLKEVARMME